jgi:hypothetical protein
MLYDNVMLVRNEGPASHANFPQKLMIQDFSLSGGESNSEVSTLDLLACCDRFAVGIKLSDEQ